MWVFEPFPHCFLKPWSLRRAPMHLRSQDAEIACNRASANSQEVLFVSKVSHDGRTPTSSDL